LRRDLHFPDVGTRGDQGGELLAEMHRNGERQKVGDNQRVIARRNYLDFPILLLARRSRRAGST
jgi:hypothetical protein